MNYKEISTKIKKMEPLTSEEVEFFEREFIPAPVFNEVNNQKKELQGKFKEVEAQIDQLKAELAENKEKALAESNAKCQCQELTEKIEILIKENSALRKEHEKNESLIKASVLACKNDLGVIFKDSGYLAYRANKAGVNLDDTEKTKEFLSSLYMNEPELFLIPVKGGAGTGLSQPANVIMDTNIRFDYEKKELNCCNCKRNVVVLADLMYSPSVNYIWTCPKCKTENNYDYSQSAKDVISISDKEDHRKNGAVIVRKK